MGALFVLHAVGSRKITAGILLYLEFRLLMGRALYVFLGLHLLKPTGTSILFLIFIFVLLLSSSLISLHPPFLEVRLLNISSNINPLNPELNPICYFLALLGAHHFLHVSKIRVKLLTLRRLMSYIYMEHPFLMFLDHTQRRSTVGRTPLDE